MPVTSGREWRSRDEAVEFTLPSGKVALLKKPDVLEILADPDIPDLLTNKVMEGMTGEKPKAEIQREDIPRLLKTLNKMCVACFVSPRVVETAQADDEIEVRHIDFQDKLAVFNFAFGQEGVLAQSFRHQPLADVPDLPNGKKLRALAKRNTQLVR